MRRLMMVLALMAAGMTQLPAQSRADWGVSADLPLSTTLTASSGGTSDTFQDGTPTGIIAAVSFPGFLGVGIESYSVPLKKKTGLDTYKISMFDLLFNLPIPVVKIALGLGAGNASFDPETLDAGGLHFTYQSTTLTQFVASIGVSVLPTLDVHLGYRKFSGIHKVKFEVPGSGLSSENDLTVDGSTISAGVGFTF